MISPVAGINFSYHPGQIVDWSDEEEAQRLIERAHAEQVTPEVAKLHLHATGLVPRKHPPRAPQIAVK
jgi:hypothetical protein